MRRATTWRGTTARRRLPRAGSRLLPLFGVVGLSVALSGCLGSTFAYVSHRNSDGTEVYFKIPARWTMFNAKQIVESDNGPLSNAQINQIESGQWITAFNASPKASIKSLLNQSASYPNGIVIARQLSEDDRDAMSLAGMRAEILGSDPLAADTNSPFNVLNYSEAAWPGGIRESRLVTDINENGGVIATYGQVVAVDPQTNYVYAIAVTCKASCWGPNQGLINQILSSWNVKEQK